MFVDFLGYAAAALVFATFYARSIVWLRALAISSNVAFISYGLLDDLPPIVILHISLLPVNVMRLLQVAAFDHLHNFLNPRRNNFSVVGMLGRWRERELQRRELATMSSGDFGDLPVSCGLIRSEQRRWPWQHWSEGWAAIRKKPGAPRA